jgi:hypothetical protein
VYEIYLGIRDELLGETDLQSLPSPSNDGPGTRGQVPVMAIVGFNKKKST